MIIGIIILVIILAIVGYFISIYNSLVMLNNREQEAFATMDVYLKKRWDLIPNLVETVKGYAKHEKETLENVINLRNGAYDQLPADEKMDINNKLTSGINKIMMLAENYPDLKANENFLGLSSQLTKIEEDIANSRKYYNGVVRNFNDKVQMFPSSIVAGMFGFKIKTFFEIDEVERENIKVSF